MAAGNNHQSPSYATYIAVWAGLVLLTGVTIGVARLHLGNWSVFGALLIASVKAGLVLSIFMHLRYEKPIFRYILLLAVVTLSLIIGMTYTDTLFR